MSLFFNTFNVGTTMRTNSELHLFCLIICLTIMTAHAQIRRCANPNPPYTVAEKYLI
jgi:hypothetical protein